MFFEDFFVILFDCFGGSTNRHYLDARELHEQRRVTLADIHADDVLVDDYVLTTTRRHVSHLG